ncbi:MAG: protein kinase [Candidatus Zixiibacteriota bacterium]|nr:MAG: protein kinase [candidate division Zixibacteria bacterium]
MEPENDKTHTHITLAKDTMVGHYRIVEKIGAGGMGEVYLAEDTELDRKVALKFLPPHLCQDEDCRKRFKREAQAAAKLDHPNIISVYEVSEYQGRPYFAMAHVEGRSLKEVASDKDLPIEQILELAIQICDGLHAAHENGVTHRDIKPSNILVDSHGRARIVDFGLAAVRDADQLTKTGSTMGTVGYMSPEQVQGREVDHRSDLFSLGVVVYELIARQNPFRRDSEAATLRAVSDDRPEPLARYKTGLPDGIQMIIDKALEKDVGLRYQSMNDLATDLKRLTRAGLGIARHEDPRPSVAVLPFADMSRERDQQYFCDGLTEEIISALACVRELRVVSRTSSFSFRETHEDIREIGRKLNVSSVLEGSIRRAGNRIRITAQLIDTQNGYHRWTEKYDRDLEDVFAIQDDVTASIVNALRPELLKDKIAVARPQTTNMEAYSEYLRGLAQYNLRSEDALKRSLEHFTRAASLDPRYTLAHCGMADAYNVMAGYCVIHPRTGLVKSKEAAAKALELDLNCGEAYSRMGMNLWELDQDIAGAERAFKKALQLTPNSVNSMLNYGEMLLGLGRLDEASSLIEEALNLDPLSFPAQLTGVTLALYHGDTEKTDLLTDQLTHVYPDLPPFLRHRSRILAGKGYFDEAISDASRAVEMAGENPMYLSQLGYARGLSGNHNGAVECLGRMKAVEPERFVPSYERAVVYLGMGDLDKALIELEQGADEGYCRILFINVNPLFDPLRQDPRFQNLVKRLNLV